MVLLPICPREGPTCCLSGTQLVSPHFCTQFVSAREMPGDEEGRLSGKSSWKGLTTAQAGAVLGRSGRHESCTCTWPHALALEGPPKATRRELLHQPCKHWGQEVSLSIHHCFCLSNRLSRQPTISTTSQIVPGLSPRRGTLTHLRLSELPSPPTSSEQGMLLTPEQSTPASLVPELQQTPC